MENCYRGEIRFMNSRRLSGPLEVSLPVSVAFVGNLVFVDAGPLGTALCERKANGTYEGVPFQVDRMLPFRLVIRHVVRQQACVRILFEGIWTEALCATELPNGAFVWGEMTVWTIDK